MSEKENWKRIEIYYQHNVAEATILDAVCHELEIRDILSIINGNSDQIKIDGTVYYFETVQYEDTLYIIYIDTWYDGHRPQIEKMLRHFFEKDFQNHFTKKYSDWNEFTDNCIAYRGSEGDTYTIWQFADKSSNYKE